VNRPLLITIAGVVAVTIAIGLNYFFSAEKADDKAAIQKPAAPAITTPASKPAPKIVLPIKPSFDVVRVNPQGDTVIAGRAAPGSTVIILDRGKVIGKVIADRRGEWVFVPDKPLAPGSRQLSLEMQQAGKDPVKSESDVVLVVPEREKDIAGRTTGKESQALALKVPRQGSGPTTVLQKTTAHKVGDLSVDIVDYDDLGQLSIGGQSLPQSQLNIYLSNQFVGQAMANDKGQWRLELKKPVAPGLYTLRVDQVDSEGKVLARVAFPFTRSKPITSMQSGAFVIVQPGNSLWRISRRKYGTGFQYSVIYEANKDQIKKPELIYPGQIFTLPSSGNR
jgi:nucleoid-associated protein YgaU